MTEHWFWLLLTAACLAWYSTITVYVAVRGLMDIRQMLRADRPASGRRAVRRRPGKSGSRLPGRARAAHRRDFPPPRRRRNVFAVARPPASGLQ